MAVIPGAVGSGAISAAATSGPPRPLERTELTILDAVLCSEMGVHFSPCGRYLAVCVACQVRSPETSFFLTALVRGLMVACVLSCSIVVSKYLLHSSNLAPCIQSKD